MTATIAPTAVRWTVVARTPRARYFRPVANAVVGTWHEARDAANAVAEAFGTMQVWLVPTQDSPQHEEDRDNVMVDSGKRIPIRWDAAPQIDAARAMAHAAYTDAVAAEQVDDLRAVMADAAEEANYQRDCAAIFGTVHLAPCGDDFATEQDADDHAATCGACEGVMDALPALTAV